MNTVVDLSEIRGFYGFSTSHFEVDKLSEVAQTKKVPN